MHKQILKPISSTENSNIQPMVSIITPTYNHQQFIGACIESVLSQTYNNWEMIIIDDGSTDRTWKIIKEYAARDVRIRPFRQENKGIWRLAETYNFALRQSCGELIAVLEGDDIWVAEKLANQVPFHVSGKKGITFTQAQFIDAADRITSKKIVPIIRNQNSEFSLFYNHLAGAYMIPALSLLFSRNVLESIGGFQQPEYLPVVDYPTCITIGKLYGYHFLPQVLGYWRQSAGQATWQLSRNIARGNYRFAQEFLTSEKFYNGEIKSKSQNWLLSSNRRRYLADSSYRAAAIAYQQHNVQNSLEYSIEIIQLKQYKLFFRCLLMLLWKFLRSNLTRMSR